MRVITAFRGRVGHALHSLKSVSWLVRRPALVIAVALAALLIAANAHYLFRAALYEDGDLAANSLAVRRAKSFRQIYGQYSRFGFRHPGPAWFYLFAAGEGFFRDTLHAVPTPANGQLLALLAVQVSFLAGAVATAARWVREKAVFLALALVAAAAHFSAVGHQAFLSNWMPHVMAMPLLALVVSAASVAAGRGTDLPLLALAGAGLVNSHVAAPMIVGSIMFAAYGGLFWSIKRERQLPWRLFPRSHVAVLVIAIICAVPVAIDLTRGSNSNMALILRHMRTHQGEHHSWRSAITYIVEFGVYAPSRGEPGLTEAADEPGPIEVISANPVRSCAWAVACITLVLGTIRGGSKRFARSSTIVILLAIALALYWARIQDGAMLYFNAWYLYGLYFALALASLVAITEIVPQTFFTVRRRRVIAGAAVCAAIAAFALRVERFRRHDLDEPSFRAMHDSVGKALRADGGAPTVARLFSFSDRAWNSATAAVLDLERRGYVPKVKGWQNMFGSDVSSEDPLAHTDGQSEPIVWRLASVATDRQAKKRPLRDGVGISLAAPVLDPATRPKLSFQGPADGSPASFIPYAVYGWAPPPPNGEWSWNDGYAGVMEFVPAPLPAGATGVEMEVDFSPAITAGWRDRQRLALEFNGTRLGEWEFRQPQPFSALIPSALWTASGSRPARLRWSFPDAISPAEIGRSGDERKMAFSFREVTFRVVSETEPAR